MQELKDARVSQALATAKKYNAEAKLLEAQAEGQEAVNEVNRIIGEVKALEGETELASDWNTGYFVFDSSIGSMSTESLLHELRRYSRIYGGQPITIELISPGGSIIDGFRAYDELRRLSNDGHKITIRVRGHAASMAAILVQAADVRQIGPNAFMMLHRAGFGVSGKAFEVEDMAEFVKTKLEARIITILSERSGRDEEYFADLFKARKDIWLTASEAVELGLADEVV